MKFNIVAAVLFLFTALTASAWKPAGDRIMTAWGENLGNMPSPLKKW